MYKNKHPKTRILIVDDDSALLEMYEERLKIADYQIMKAKNGEEGLAKAVDFLPHLILLDIKMPKINGQHVLNILKNTPETVNIPIIILTSVTQEEYKEKLLADGADDYIVKSEVMPREVVSKIEKVISENKKKLKQFAQ